MKQVRCRTSAFSAGSSPSMRIVPDEGNVWLQIVDIRVVLPAPFGPTRP